MSARFPILYQLFGGYFHQDWKCDHDTEDEVIRTFVAEASSETLSKVKDELKFILRTTQNEDQIQEILFEEIGCSYYYPYAWPSGRAWLEHVLGMLH
jgi:NifU-like protein involved in Fe-S cluster formation